MSKLVFTPRNFVPASLDIINTADDILHDYAAQGYTLTLRQLYYQFVARDLLPNTEKNYKRLGSIINDARLAGLIDWDHMADRTRNIMTPATWENPSSILGAVADQYSPDLWIGQTHRVEVWVEKDALAEVVEQACQPYQVPHFSCRGYASLSSLWEAANRFTLHAQNDTTPVIIHLGDHDPSGIDMSRDIHDRLGIFLEYGIKVKRIALNMDQVTQYSPPPNPTKVTDSRAGGYIRDFGHECWELDALEPSVLEQLIQDTIQEFIDPEPWERAETNQQEGRELLRQLAEEVSGDT